MKFSEKWLREWVDPDLSTDELVAQLTMAGLEVDSVEPAAGEFTGIVVGEVLDVQPHPDADKLRVCRVNAGGDPLQIVCGAPNVATGMKVPTALLDAKLPGGMKIKKAKLRGVESTGMLCSARELGLSEDHQGLMALPASAPVGADLRDYLKLDDKLIEVDLTPNRGDCLGLAGIAREIGVLTRCHVTHPAMDAIRPVCEDRFEIKVGAADGCPRYLGRVIRDIDPGATTPLWMQERLRRSGIRSLGPLVDVTNYVLVELGQPMHAFDLAQLDGFIDVRFARAEESLRLLDGRDVALDRETLVIADASKVLAIAGVMGGEASGINDATRDLFLECAFFAPELIAGRARRYGLQTDSSHRFERGVDFELQERAMERATQLLLEIVGGRPGPITEVRSEADLPRREPLNLRRDRILRLLGVELPDAEIEDILRRLGCKLAATAPGWEVIPPSYRFDIALEVDLIEEVGRVYGYNRLPSSRPTGAMQAKAVPEHRVGVDSWRTILVQRGYQEAITYSFVDPQLQRLLDPECPPVALSNPISSEMSVMRTNLWPGLVRVAQYNLNRQQNRGQIFEYGLNYIGQLDNLEQKAFIGGLIYGTRHPEQWGTGDVPVDFYDVKADIESLLGAGGVLGDYQFSAGRHPALHPGRTARIERRGVLAGWLGNLHPELVKKLELPESTLLFELDAAILADGSVAFFSEISRFPAIRRDLAFIVPEQVAAGEFCAAARAAAGPLLQELTLFDLYQGKGIESGRKSIALGLILQDSSRTLAEQDIEAVLVQVQTALNDKFGATLRE